MIDILETPINVVPSNGQVQHAGEDFSFQFTGDNLSVTIGRLFDIDRNKEIKNWWCKHNINATNENTIFTHPKIKDKCILGKDYKYYYEIFQKNPNIPTEVNISGTKITEDDIIKLLYNKTKILVSTNSFAEKIDMYKSILEDADFKITPKSSQDEVSGVIRNCISILSNNTENDKKTGDYLLMEFESEKICNQAIGYLTTNEDGFSCNITFNQYNPLADIYMASGSIDGYKGSVYIDSFSGYAMRIKNAINNIKEPIKWKFNDVDKLIGAMYVEVAGVRRRITGYSFTEGTETHEGTFIITYDVPFYFGKKILEYQNANGYVPFRIYCNYIRTPWYDFKYRTKPTITLNSPTVNENGLNCSFGYSQAENISMKSYEYEIFAGNEYIEINAPTDNKIKVINWQDVETNYVVQVSLPKEFKYDSNNEYKAELYKKIANGVFEKQHSGAIRIISYDNINVNGETEHVLTLPYGGFDIYNDDETGGAEFDRIVITEIKQTKESLFNSGKIYSYDTKYAFQIPTTTSNYTIRAKVTTQENDTAESTVQYKVKPDKYADEFIIDTDNDVSGLPTTDKESDDYCSVGSMALSISTGNVYILNSNGKWVNTSTWQQETQTENILEE